MGKITLLLLTVLIWLQYSLWMGKNGIYDYIRVNKDVISVQNINILLKARNDQLFIEVHDLNEGEEVLEERARYELGMIRRGETFYRLVPEQRKVYEISSLYNKTQK
ncbi:essential cell division protein [Serratia symbiotica str. 'Cinara cedri']|nr:essential cell division protein [Serratia symbiotica str. 'Cinara cedri']